MVNTPNTHCKGAYSCTCHKGSYTLEAAVILPMMAGFFVAILFFFRVLQIQTGVQEATIRRVEGYEGFRMDCLICETKVNVTYEYVPVFWGYVTLVEAKPERIGIQRTSQYSYLYQWSEDT